MTLKLKNKLINVKKDERSKQDQELKPQKVKALPDNLIVDKHIENFEELKKSAEVHQEAYTSEKTQQKSKYKQLLLNLQYTLPCKYCRINLKNNFKKHPLVDKIFKNRYNFSYYIFNLHEHIRIERNSDCT